MRFCHSGPHSSGGAMSIKLEWSRQPSSLAPAVIRESTLRYANYFNHYDFDFGSELVAGSSVRIVDCGDVFEVPGCYEDNSRMATAVIRKILERGAVPFIFGGECRGSPARR
jgi:arginase family enzyme